MFRLSIFAGACALATGIATAGAARAQPSESPPRPPSAAASAAPRDTASTPHHDHGAMAEHDHASMSRSEPGAPMHDHGSMPGALGPHAMSREASGTSWQPDATPMAGVHFGAGDWSLMAHGLVNVSTTTRQDRAATR